MKRFIDTPILGGARIFNSDLRDLLQNPFYDILNGWMTKNREKCKEGYIMSGCQVTANGSNWDVAAGSVFLDGEFRVFEGGTDLATGFLIADSDEIIQRNDKDNNPEDIIVIKKATHTTIQPTFPTQYIRIDRVNDGTSWKNPEDEGFVFGTEAVNSPSNPIKVRKTIDGRIEMRGEVDLTASSQIVEDIFSNVPEDYSPVEPTTNSSLAIGTGARNTNSALITYNAQKNILLRSFGTTVSAEWGFEVSYSIKQN